MKYLFAISVIAVSALSLSLLVGFIRPMDIYSHTHTTFGISKSGNSGLEENALEKVLQNASPIFGVYANVQSPSSTWMSEYDDDTLLVHMNIPGTHDTATWNFSKTTQQALVPITNLVSPGLEVESTFYRCQQHSIVNMLNAGIRAFDLRYALDVTKSYLVFWHGRALQSQTASVEDVLFGFYKWLDDHPSEVLFLSLKFEGSDAMRNSDNVRVQQKIFDALTRFASSKYTLQRKNGFGTLGEARGKIVLLRRFDLDLLPTPYQEQISGVHFSPKQWTDNGANIELIYNELTGEAAYIQDYYHPLTEHGSSIAANIDVKYDATTSHFEFAAKEKPDSLMWHFASSTHTDNDPPNTPQIQALGDESTPGVNHHLIEYLQTMRGKRLGITMFDFYDEPDGLVPLYLSLLKPGPRSSLKENATNE